MKHVVYIFLLFSFQLMGQIPLLKDKIVLTNEAQVNSKDLDYSPSFYKDGIVFVSTRNRGWFSKVKDKNIGTNVMSIFHAKRDSDGYLQKPEAFAEELITKMHEGPLTFDRTGKTIYFTRNDIHDQATDGKKKMQIYASELGTEGWSNLLKLSFNQSEFNFSHPAISIDMDALYFASDRPGGFGGMDLYVVYKKGEAWSEPQNLGAEVNSEGNEVFPFIHADGTLYFASDRSSSLGGLDIYYSKQEKEEWIAPINLGEPFNSKLDDFGLIVDLDNKNGYFSSNRPRGLGEDDIYSFYIIGDVELPLADGTERQSKDLNLVVKDKNGSPIEDVEISYLSLDKTTLANSIGLKPSGENPNDFILSVDTDKIGNIGKTNTSGLHESTLEEGNYILKISKKGFIPQQILVNSQTDLSNLNISLSKAENCINLRGRVLSEDRYLPQVGNMVQIVDVNTKEAITVYTDINGQFEYCLPCRSTFSIYAQKDGIASPASIITTKGISCASEQWLETVLYINELDLVPIVGARIRLPNIYFNFDDATLRPDAKKDLTAVLELMQTYEDMTIELASHTDSRGGDAYNLELSQRRSASVYQYLISRGIVANRMQVKGYGESNLRNHCSNGVKCTEREHQFNRRTEIVILSNGLLGEENTNSGYKDLTVSLQIEDFSGGNSQRNTSISSTQNYQQLKSRKKVSSALWNDDPFGVGNTPNDGSFYVVTSEFEELAKAHKFSQDLIDAGYFDSKVYELSAGQKHGVFVQKFSSKFAAEALIEQLKRDMSINASIKKNVKGLELEN